MMVEAFSEILRLQDVKLPLRVSDKDCGVVHDADGRCVFVVDPDNERPDEQATAIATWIALAVNTCGGFMAVKP